MTMDGVTVITCTGGRPEALKVCSQIMWRNKKHCAIQWIIVDDVDDGDNCLEFSNDWGAVVRPQPRWTPGQNTLARNILHALPHVKQGKIIVMEDDDLYPPGYIEKMSRALDDAPLVGGIPARYYHVPSRRYRIFDNQHHASLCETAMRAEVLPTLKAICESNDHRFIDARLWEEWQGPKKFIRDSGVVGMKGLPGRPGIGIGHQPDRQPQEWYQDPHCQTLRSWIGNDIELYRPFLGAFPERQTA